MNCFALPTATVSSVRLRESQTQQHGHPRTHRAVRNGVVACPGRRVFGYAGGADVVLRFNESGGRLQGIISGRSRRGKTEYRRLVGIWGKRINARTGKDGPAAARGHRAKATGDWRLVTDPLASWAAHRKDTQRPKTKDQTKDQRPKTKDAKTRKKPHMTPSGLADQGPAAADLVGC
ncbi:hypothetical protein K490DRAFT_56994 [Saccharata proteae CBS 121410]|uniref:Uncharacterized protein n=1 Tax=Saccharata proteae CBS 121410 TaxID=1314787 RepID=A0A9P4LZY7_9PEZI|nr:hypothetical protein K490DRAFT_56994 [Saccharata proteae CBS 121410]